MKWTAEQQEAISYSGENILLAAAAGSGKTAVLVQRIIELISRTENPVNIDELLVLTFTDAAAREMREKISDAIEKTLRESPDDRHLQKQRLLMHSASISTIHSFCLNLLKNNIHMTDLPVNFSLISETENKMLLENTLDSVLNRFYGKIERDPSIAALVMGYGGIKNDASLRETVLGLFNFSKSMAYPAKWLNAAVAEYRRAIEDKSVANTVWQNELRKKTEQTMFYIADIYRDINREIELRLDSKHSYAPFFAEEAAALRRVFDHMDMDSYSSVRDALNSFEFERMAAGTRKAEGAVLAAQEKIKALRSLAKAVMDDLWELYKIPESDMLDRIEALYPILRTLKNIVLITDRSYTKRKREKNFLDFSDLEHEALKLLDKKDGEESPVSAALRQKYSEILIDEYQDTNHIQDTIFKKSSRESRNIFMVGDLKQSIYTFRNAVPKLFSDKYTDYGREGGGGHLIRLFKNFRSRTQVVDSVNFIFSRIMDLSVGDVDYTEDEYLIHGAEYYPIPEEDGDFTPEFHFACSNAEVEEGEIPLDRHELEAAIAAGRIRQMIDSKTLVFDKALQRMRPVEYRDIVVLMRNTKAAAPVFEQVFEESSIPVYTEVGKSYLSSPEVQTVLSFLQIADNPRQDIPLIAVMRSPIWGFSPEELGEMRSRMHSGCFLDAVQLAAEDGNEKAKGFLDSLEDFRRHAEVESVERLVWRIYYEYGYYAYSGARSHGVMRQANLRLLFERAAEFEHTGLCGLFNFMNYIEMIKSQGDDLTPAKTLSDGDNVVRIMTIHKSKGLEFPVVILADTGHEFNMMDLNSNIIWNTEGGIAADYVDTKLRVRYPALPRSIVSIKAKAELVSEEMRLLYVALTRAREKLIVTATYKQTKSGPSLPLYGGDGRAKAAYIQSRRCFKDWIMAAILTHPDAENLREEFGFSGCIDVADSDFSLKTYIYKSQAEIPAVELMAADEEACGDIAFDIAADEIKKRIEYEYPGAYLGKIPVKLSVSEVKRMQAEEDEYTPALPQLKVASEATFERITGAERGTVVHFVMQQANPCGISSVADVEELIAKMVQRNVISEGQAKAVDANGIFAFFDSSLGRRMKSAKRLEREFSFYTTASIDEIYQNGQEGEILLQGTMDCFFEEEDGRLVLIDFKTDRARDKADVGRLAQKYNVQMKYYKKALKEIMQREVDECYLYFLDAGEMVEM